METKFIERIEDGAEKGDVMRFDWRVDLNQCVNVHELEHIMNQENRALDIKSQALFDLGDDYYNK